MDGKEPNEPKTIFEYENYRIFLRDYYESARLKNKKFSFRFFSRIAGFKSSGSILKVMNGQTNLSVDGIAKISAALKLNKEESGFFENLVLFNQSTTAEERQHYARALIKSRSYRKLKPLSSTLFKYFSQWYYSVIRELVNLPGFKEDPEWIVAQLNGPITVAEVKDALSELVLLGLLSRDGNGKLIMTNAHVTSGDELNFSGAARCHRQYLDRAYESIDIVPREKRDLSAMTLGISEEMAKKIKALVQEFRKEVVEVISGDTGSEQIYQLNIQLFPLTKLSSRGPK